MIKKNMTKNVVGIMSGTSLDGVDFVLCRVGAKEIKYCDRAYVKFSPQLRLSLEGIAEGFMGFRESQKIHFKLGEFYYKSLLKIINKKSWKVDLIGLHGQTVFHDAPNATCQIGEPSYLTKLGCSVVSDFRSKLIAYKTQAAPLAPIFHDAILQGKSWAFLNLGGMSNVTYKDSAGKLTATDLGPANIFLDKAARDLFDKPYDKSGGFCRRGLPDFKIVENYLQKEKFFSRRIPKSCGREDFSEKAYRSLMREAKELSDVDKMATLAEISLAPIIKFLKKKTLRKIVVSGGGAKNLYFINRLKYEFADVDVATSESLDWPEEAIEAGAFAFLAYKKIMNKKINLTYLGLDSKFGPLGRVD